MGVNDALALMSISGGTSQHTAIGSNAATTGASRVRAERAWASKLTGEEPFGLAAFARCCR